MLPVFSAVPSYSQPAKSTEAATAVAFLVADNLKLSPVAIEADVLTGGLIARAIASGRFSGKSGQVTQLIAPASLGVERIIIAGLGKSKEIDGLTLEAAAGHILAESNRLGITHLTIVQDESLLDKEENKGEAAARLALGITLKSYRFDKYRTKEKADDKPSVSKVTIATKDLKHAPEQFAPYHALAEGIALTRNLVTEPANIIYPETLAAACKNLEQDGVKVTILGEKEMAKLGMGALLGVGQGSVRESQLVIMEWLGGAKDDKPVAFVGKGVCFDTGGISIKPAGGMEEMKWDMGGAGAVIGLIKTLAGRNAKVNAIGVVGLVENMPDGNAQRPGDVVTSMSGQTIEVLNTDAEGRLVLADALWYTQDTYKPKFIVDLATLTGAIIVSLGGVYAGLFSNNDKLSKRLSESGEATGEKVWRFPLCDAYDKMINSDIADMQNIGAERQAGSITAAQFLQRFVNDTPWAHLDIAGTAWSKKDAATCPKGATGFGVRLLDNLVREHYEG
jgi:leucyl aminopeptidase